MNPLYAVGSSHASPDRTVPAMSDDDHYVSGVAVGGKGGTSLGAHRAGGYGMVVITWDGLAW